MPFRFAHAEPPVPVKILKEEPPGAAPVPGLPLVAPAPPLLPDPLVPVEPGGGLDSELEPHPTVVPKTKTKPAIARTKLVLRIVSNPEGTLSHA